MKVKFSEELMANIRSIKVLILDVDGVLTDGKIIVDDVGREIKQFNAKDGQGLKILIRYGIDVILLTGRKSEVVEHRAKDLGINEVYQGIRNKVEMYEKILRKRRLIGNQMAYVGDDIVDIPFMKRVGFSVAVADAAKDVKKTADYVTRNKGGRGAVREVCEIILQIQGKWDDVASRYEFD